MRRNESLNRNCVDCGASISPGYQRCTACKAASQRSPQKHCVDCGTPVDLRATRCPACAAANHRKPRTSCARCGKSPIGRKNTWCWECSYAMRGKRTGRPPVHCVGCGKAMPPASKGYCMACRTAGKKPERHCPDCGVVVQWHVARCRKCTGIAKRVRQAAEDMTYGYEWPGQRTRALRRAGNCCACCGGRKQPGGRDLHIHHIVPYRVTHDSENRNLSALCATCHYALHAAYRRAGCCEPDAFRSVFVRFLSRNGARKVNEGQP